ATFLTVEERGWLTAELSLEERQKKENDRAREGRLLADGRLWRLTVTYFLVLIGFWVLTFWMPLMLKNLSGGYSNTSIGLLVMIPYWVALVVMVAVGRSSDARLERRYHAAVPLMAAALSLILLVTSADQSLPLSILLWCLIAAGIYSVFGPFWSLPAEFLT